jgi:hypothetical protein
MPQPPELAAVVRRVANHNFGGHKRLWLVDCKNGSVFTRHLEGGAVALGVYCPLCPETGLCVVPPFPTFLDHAHRILDRIVSKEEEGVLSYHYVLGEWTRETRNFRLRVYMLQDGVWCMHSSATEQLLHPLSLSASKVLLVGNKIYVADLSSGDILVMDLTAPSLSRIPLPQGLKCPLLNAAISRADDASSVYLTHVHVNKLVNVWLHKGDNWLLVHTICLREMWVNLRMQDHTFEDVQINFPYICEVGDNAECVLLKVYGWTLYLDVKSRTLCKVHGTAETNGITVIHPFKMIWPPTFPAVKADLARFAFLPLDNPSSPLNGVICSKHFSLHILVFLLNGVTLLGI